MSPGGTSSGSWRDTGCPSTTAPAREQRQACILLKINPPSPGEPGDEGCVWGELKVGRTGGVGGRGFISEEIIVILSKRHRAWENWGCQQGPLTLSLTHSHTFRHTFSHTNTLSYSHTHAHLLTLPLTHSYAHSHTFSHKYSLAVTHIFSNTHSHTFTYTDTPFFLTHSHTLTYSLTHSHAFTTHTL